MAKYEVVAVHRDSLQEIRRTFPSAPSEQHIARWLSYSNVPNNWLATRYYPSRKGWLIFDFAHAHRWATRGVGRALWRGVKRDKRVYPSEDAAVMKIRHLLNLPEQLALIP